MATEFWMIAVPQEQSARQSLEKLNNTASKSGLTSIFGFPIPDLKVCNLDALLTVSDKLAWLDTVSESVVRRIAQVLGDVMENSTDKLLENALANGVDLVSYITRFEWDMAKYPTTLPVNTLTEVIGKVVSQADTELKARASTYNNIKASLLQHERRAEGNLMTRPLSDVVKQEDLVLDSEYLTTLLVIVPKTSYTVWEKTYESMSDFVVPRTSRMVLEDPEGGIFTVTLFKKAIDEFKAKAKENRFAVRPFSFEETEQQKQEMAHLTVDKKEQYGNFIRWLKVNFSEVFIAWIHVKALRVFVESAMRYGLPVNFKAVLLQPDRKGRKKLRQVLNSLFTHLDTIAASTKQDMRLDIPGLSMGPQEYYPYIYFKVDVNVVEL